MLRTNTTHTVSPTEQMYAWNRINGNQLGDPVTTAITVFADAAKSVITTISRLFGGGGDPYKDIHIAQQNAAVAGFQNILSQIQLKLNAQTLTQSDLNAAAAAITSIYQAFNQYTSQLAQQHPGDASRYTAGAQQVQALGQSLIAGMAGSSAGQFVAAHPQSGISSAIASVTSAFTNPTGGISTTGIAILAAGIFFLPKLLSRKGLF